MNIETQYRLIKKKVVYLPVGEKLYRTTKILEEVVQVPCIDLTVDTDGLCEFHRGLQPSRRESTASNATQCANTPTYCQCEEHREFSNNLPSESEPHSDSS